MAYKVTGVGQEIKIELDRLGQWDAGRIRTMFREKLGRKRKKVLEAC